MSATVSGHGAAGAVIGAPTPPDDALERIAGELVVRLLAQSASGRLSFRQIKDALSSMEVEMTADGLSRLAGQGGDPRTMISAAYVERVSDGLAITVAGWRHVERR